MANKIIVPNVKIKKLQDPDGNLFFPYTITDAIWNAEGTQTLADTLAEHDSSMVKLSVNQTILSEKTFAKPQLFKEQLYFNTDTPAYKVGDVGPAGGIVFYDAGKVITSKYLDSSGSEITYNWRYMEMSPTDIQAEVSASNYINPPWGVKYSSNSWQWQSISGLSSRVGMGRYNTSKIVNTLGPNFEGNYYASSNSFPAAGAGNYAARVCQKYSTVVNGVTYSDWFLPSIEELKFIYANIHKAGVKSMSRWYWSSSQFDSYRSWGWSFADTYLDNSTKYNCMNTVAVRGFI